MTNNLIGKSPWRVDGVAKVTGSAKFPADYAMPGMLYGYTLRTTYPNARILKMDLEEAWQVPGVEAVLTAKDIPGHNGHGVLRTDAPVLARDRVRSVNDALALVAARTPQAAWEAAKRIKVVYEELPGVFDPREAMAPGAPLVHEDQDSNILYHLKIRRGDVEDGFTRAALVVENDYSTQMVDQAFLQPEGALAYLDERGHVVIRVATQYVHWDRTEIARALGLPQNRVRVINTAVGGAFGAREDMTLQIHACLLAVHTKRPVKMVYDRRESFHAHSKRHPMYMHYKTAADANGKLLAVEATIIGDAGAYCSWSPNILRKAAVHATGPYVVPNVKVDAYAVYTNNPFTGAMRGFGAPQPAIAYEAQMDELARGLGLHPFTIRWRNVMEEGSVTATGQLLEGSVGLKETMVKAARVMGWDIEKEG